MLKLRPLGNVGVIAKEIVPYPSLALTGDTFATSMNLVRLTVAVICEVINNGGSLIVNV